MPPRDDDRTLRVSYHADRGTVVMSLWSGAACRGTFRLAADEVERLIAVLDRMGTAGAERSAA